MMTFFLITLNIRDYNMVRILANRKVRFGIIFKYAFKKKYIRENSLKLVDYHIM